jgi:excisionase family DNA binding protein
MTGTPETPSRDRLLTVGEAARLVGLGKRTLRERIHRGQIAVRIVGEGRKTKIRLTESALAEAGLLRRSASRETPPVDGNVTALAEVLREQNARLAAIEEQRLQFAGQLGAALERVRSLEARVLEMAELAPGTPGHVTPVGAPSLAATAKVGIGAATVGFFGTVAVRAITAVSHRHRLRPPASLGLHRKRVSHGG